MIIILTFLILMIEISVAFITYSSNAVKIPAAKFFLGYPKLAPEPRGGIEIDSQSSSLASYTEFFTDCFKICISFLLP